MGCWCSSSHWWHAPIYISMSLLLAAIVITSPPSSSSSLSHDTISLNASSALKSHGFTIIATLLQLSPSLFLSNSSSSTIFAIHDDAVSNLTTTPSAMKLLLQYHTSPSKLSLQQLLLKPLNSCLPTSLLSNNLTVTKIDPKNRFLDINYVPISHPDLFMDDRFSIHGVLAPFTPLDSDGSGVDLDFIRHPPCDFSGVHYPRPEYADKWVRMIRALSSIGYISFAIGLNSVLHGILQEYPNLGPITVFAPPQFAFVSGPGPLLERVVRYHIVGQRYSFLELASLPEKANMTTLLRDECLQITSVNGSDVVAINGVYVVPPSIFSTDMFVVHGIYRAFELPDYANS